MRLTVSDADCKGDDELLHLSIISFFPPFFFTDTVLQMDWFRLDAKSFSWTKFSWLARQSHNGRRMNRCGCANAATNASLHPSQNSDKCISYYLMRSLTSSSRCSSKLHHLISAAVWLEPPLQCVCPAIYWFPRSPQNPNRPTTHCILEKWFTMRWITATASFYAIFTPIEGQKQVFYSR